MSLWHKGRKNIFGARILVLLNFAFKSAIRTIVFLLRKIAFCVQTLIQQNKNFVTEDRK